MKKHSRFAAILASAILAAAIPFSMVSATENEEITERSSSAIQWLHSVYPNGSYYSTTGTACTCHDYSYCFPGTTDSRCTCINYDLASQCDGFARYCYYCYNDEHVEYYDDDYSGDTVELTSSNLYSYLQAMGNCTYVRGYTSDGSIHSVFIVSYTDTTVTVYQANYGGRCLVKYETVPYSTFLNYMNEIAWCVTGGSVPSFIPGPDIL